MSSLKMGRKQSHSLIDTVTLGYDFYRLRERMQGRNGGLVKIATFVVLSFALPLIAEAQTTKQRLLIADQCKDSVGSSVLFQFKEAVRTSASYTLNESPGKRPIFVEMVCVDASPLPSAPAAAVSITAYFYKLGSGACFDYVPLYHGVRYAKIQFTKEAAVAILAAIDEGNSPTRLHSRMPGNRARIP